MRSCYQRTNFTCKMINLFLLTILKIHYLSGRTQQCLPNFTIEVLLRWAEQSAAAPEWSSTSDYSARNQNLNLRSNLLFFSHGRECALLIRNGQGWPSFAQALNASVSLPLRADPSSIDHSSRRASHQAKLTLHEEDPAAGCGSGSRLGSAGAGGSRKPSNCVIMKARSFAMRA